LNKIRDTSKHCYFEKFCCTYNNIEDAETFFILNLAVEGFNLSRVSFVNQKDKVSE